MKKGIILAGGTGTRLRPLTDFVCKQLLPIYDKPLIYYPLSTLILAGIEEILIISTPKDTPILQGAIGDGSQFGISVTYKIQEKPAGIAEAFIIGEDFIDNDPICLILGDNILHMAGFTTFIEKAFAENEGATIFGFPVADPQRFGVVEVDSDNAVLSIEEKPEHPKSNLAIIGMYAYDSTVVEKAKSIKASARGELEITDLNQLYFEKGKLKCHRLSRGNVWIDAGVTDSFADAANLVRLIENRLGLKICCPEEAAFVMNKITRDDLKELAKEYSKSHYGKYLKRIASDDAE